VKRNIEFVKSQKNRKDDTTNTILLSSLKITHGDVFKPKHFNEFFVTDNYCYKNRFTPSQFMYNRIKYEFIHMPTMEIPPMKKATPYSVHMVNFILEYIYLIADFKKENFLYIMNWMAFSFQNLGDQVGNALVFIGSDTSHIDILFNNIISELFRKEYCLEIDEEMLELKGLSNMLEEKLIYYFRNVRDNENGKFKLSDTVKKLITKKEFYIEKDKCHPKKFRNYAQTIIVAEKPYIPFLEKDGDYFTVLKIPYISDEALQKICKGFKVADLIFNDLRNFSNILMGYSVDENLLGKPLENDDRNVLIKSLEDKVKSLAEAIINKNIDFFSHVSNKNSILYREIKSDFQNNIFMQINLLKCFNILYPEEKKMIPVDKNDTRYKTRTLMKLLKEIDRGFFSNENLSTNSKGLKYFSYS